MEIKTYIFKKQQATGFTEISNSNVSSREDYEYLSLPLLKLK